MGFLPFLIAAFAAIAHIAPVVASVVGTAAAVHSLTASQQQQVGGSSDPNVIANAIMPGVLANLQARGIMLPSAIAPGVVHAGLLDSLSPGNQQLLLFAGIGVVAMMLLR